MTADVMRLLLLLSLIGVGVIAALFLRQRRLSFAAYIGWGFVILFLPLVGPFIVLLTGPGKAKQG
jgi:hypothetical protein